MLEYITCAAIWYKEIKLVKEIPQVRPINIDKGIVVCGHRHGHVIWTVVCLTGLRTVQFAEDGVGDHEQGFLTNLNRFVNRQEAWIIAENANQIINVSGGKGTLYSEDIY
jgi:hypothetical protein